MNEPYKPPALPPSSNPVRRFFAILGPGLVTGAADDDPSGIATYSIAGAQLGMSLLWLSWLTWPMMAAVQMMCARIGMVTGRGLAGALGQKFPRPVLMIICLLLLVANTINIAADLSGMADAALVLTGVNAYFYIIVFGLFIAFSVVHFCYHQIADTLKWLALFLFAYVITAFLMHPDWHVIARETFFPSFPRGKEVWETIVAILGTTISPYLFFWQASQEVEEEKSKGRLRKGATHTEIVDRIIDVLTGTLLSNGVMFFIILTTALTLHAHGLTQIESSREAAQALRPLAGNLAVLLYTTGILALGFLAIPTLAGASAYAFAEVFHWCYGLNRKFNKAKWFYGLIIASILIGMALNFIHINPVRALFLSAVLNGLIAPFLLVGILLVGRDRRLMQGQPSSLLCQIIVGVTTCLMFAASIAMFVV